MRILILNWRDVRHPKSGGAELVTMEHAKGWIRAGHTVTWLTASYAGASKKSIVDGVHFVRKWGSLTIYLFAPFYLLANAKKFDVVVDEVHGFPFFSPLFTRKPVVVFIHEIAGEIWDYMFSFPKNYIGKALEHLYFGLYTHNFFWTDAPSTIDELVTHGVARNRCVAIPCPLIPSHISRRTFHKEKRPTYIFVSRVVRMKGIEEIIKAFAFIVQKEPDAQLWIVGAGEEKYVTELIQIMQEYHIERHVTFYGNVSEERKFNLMARAHLLLHASVKEGWGLVVLEAASVGTPSVVYNVPGLKDVVRDGQTGIVIDNNSPQQMAKEAVRLHADPDRYERLQKNAGAWVHNLKWADVVRISEKLLVTAVQQHT